ncbi:hypothetical protein BSKO_00510 [Bryopsis sp. KO-2023]|nr:hypothetical protein BSKO_00510 [Bryopsis sp. KO-2023]
MSSDDESIPDLVEGEVDLPSKVKHEEAKSSETQQGRKPVPVTLITGFLGAGKTTLVTYILTENHGLRIAVIVNEYGDTEGVEQPLVKGPDDEEAFSTDWVELNNGCLCCSVKSDFVAALEGLMHKKDKFDYVLIETTGLANPGPVASALWTDVELEAGVCLDGIVTVVDSRNIRAQLSDVRPEGETNEAQQQIAYADVVLLNKVDLVTEKEIGDIKTTLFSINSEVEVLQTTRCHLDLKKILDLGAYDTAGAGPHAKNSDPPRSSECKHEDHSPDECNHGGEHRGSAHDHRVGTVSFSSNQPVSIQGVKEWMDRLLWEESVRKEDIYRMKGILNATGEPNRMILQAVHELYEIADGPAWGEGEVKFTKIVVIGKDLDKSALRNSFESCFA